jgi:hypothetical protein
MTELTSKPFQIHFPWEEPQLFAGEIGAAFRPRREGRSP